MCLSIVNDVQTPLNSVAASKQTVNMTRHDPNRVENSSSVKTKIFVCMETETDTTFTSLVVNPVISVIIQ